MRPLSFQWIPHQANLQPNLLLLGSRLDFNPTATFLGVTFDRTLSFSKHVSSLKEGLMLYLCFIMGLPLRSPSLFCVKLFLSLFSPGMWKRLFFKRFRFHTYCFRFRFHQQKTKKRPLTIFFNFCGSVACLLLHFIILRKQKPSFIAITLPTSLKLIVSNYSVFVFLRYQNSC